jgi:hypothetical protein
MTCVYKIQFTKNSYDLNVEYDKLSEHEKESISSMLPDSYFEFNNDFEHYVIYIMLKPLDAKKYTKILDNNLINHSIIDISKDLLNGMDFDKDLKKYVNGLNRFRWNNFNKKISEWIYDNLDMDIVLDRIGDVGIEGLNKIEKKFLDNYKV